MGGYDASFGNYKFTNPTELFTVKFKVKHQNWTEIPITIGRKTAGTELGWDLSVDNTDGYINRKMTPFDVRPEDGIYGMVYPVPTRGPITFDLTVPSNGDYYINVITFSGERINQYKKTFFSGYVSFQEDLSFLPQGVYLLQVTNGRFVRTFKIVKQ